MSTADHSALRYFTWCLFIVSAVCLFGAALNGGHIYGRFWSDSCRSGGVYDKVVPGSDMCCAGYHAGDWVCLSAFDPVERVLTRYAWILPLLPTFLSLANEALFTMIPSRIQLRRVALFFGMFVYRTFVLYLFFGTIQSYVQVSRQDIDSCWYIHLTGRCKEGFDFSDHLVMLLCHYSFPLSLQLSYTMCHSNVGRGGFLYRAGLWLVVLVCAVLLLCTFRTIFFTSLYFHTALEMFIGVVVVAVLVLTPMKYLMARSKFVSSLMSHT